MKLVIARPLREAHRQLEAELARAVKVEGRIGEAAREVASLLRPRFEVDERSALPPLGLLRALVGAPDNTAAVEDVLPTDRLKTDLPAMLAAHGTVIGALRNLAAVAEREQKPEWVRFAETLIHHIRFEAQVLYPAAILVGEHARAYA